MALLQRSTIILPAHVDKVREKCLTLDADAVCLDLEDAVPHASKEEARQKAGTFIQANSGNIWVRVNPIKQKARFSVSCGYEDLDAVVVPGLQGIKYPKIESREELIAVNEAISRAEREKGIPKNQIELHVAVESARGVHEAYHIASTGLERSLRFSFGGGDFTLTLGTAWSTDEQECFVAKSLIVIACNAAGLPQPFDGVFPAFKDLDGLRASAQLARKLGFAGKSVIHPTQIPVVNEVFSPTPEEVTWAKKVITAFDEALAAGAAAVALEGRLIDYPIVERAQHVVALQAEIEKKPKRA